MQVQYWRKLWRAWAVVGVAVTMAALVPAAAAGETVSQADPAGDVVKKTQHGFVAAREKRADIRHVRFVHTSRRVTTTIRLAKFGFHWGYQGAIKTPTHRYTVLGEGFRGDHSFFLTGFTHFVQCDGVTSAVRRATHTIRVSVPTSCLRRPRWVRVGLVLTTADGRGGVFFDDPLRDGLVKPRPVRLSPRLHIDAVSAR